jgi:hypothetical protein
MEVAVSNPSETNSLVRYDAMCRAIDAAYKVDEVKDIRDKALALAVYARQAKNMEAERKASEIRLRAERRVGTLLGEASKSGQRDSGRGGNRRSPPPETILPTLSHYGITKTQSSQWQQLSSIPDAQFEAIIKRAEKPTTNSVLSAAIPAKKKVSRISTECRWLLALILDCKSRGVLDREPSAVLRGVPHWALDDVRQIAPLAAAWLNRLAVSPG